MGLRLRDGGREAVGYYALRACTASGFRRGSALDRRVPAGKFAAATCAWPPAGACHIWVLLPVRPLAKWYCCALPGALKLLLQAAQMDSIHIQHAILRA